MYLDQWLDDPTHEPLHQVAPFNELDLRVMILVNENRAWVPKARERCIEVAKEIAEGVLPFDRPGCFFDELLLALALPEARARLEEEPDFFDILPRRTHRAASVTEDADEYWTTDEQWDLVSDAFDDRCRWDEWEVPTINNHPLLGAILARRHPHNWFDLDEETGPGYLQGLAGLLADGDSSGRGATKS